MKLRTFTAAAAAVALALLPTQASAQVVFDNGAPNAVSGSEFTQWIQAQDFTLAATTQVTGIRFWAFAFPNSPGYAGSIVWQIRNSAGNSPGTSVLFTGTFTGTPTNDGIGFVNFPRLRFDIGTDFVLDPGTYWLALHNGPLTEQTQREFYWETTGANGTARGHEDIAPFDGSWFSNNQEHAFALLGTTNVVPEPGTYALMATGLAGLGLVARRRRKA